VEFDVAIAGPICSFILHFLFSYVAYGLGKISWIPWQTPLIGIFSYLAFINLFLGIINLIPAYPLDGGRVFRAFLWAKTGDFRKATKIASTAGRVFAMFLIFWGFLETIGGDLSGLWFVFIGLFLYNAAKMGYEYVLLKDAIKGLRIENIMNRTVVQVRGNLTVGEVIRDYFLKYNATSLPVEEDGEIVGVITINQLKEIPHDKWDTIKVSELIIPLEQNAVANPMDPPSKVLTRMLEDDIDIIYVMDKGKLVGIVSRNDIVRVLKLRMDLGV